MAEVKVVVKTVDQGSRNAKNFASNVGNILDVAKKATIALAATGFAAKKAYEFIGSGAELEAARGRFENLAASIGTTSSAILKDLGDATNGMMSDAEMIASASQIISLGLADSGEGVTRLAKAVSTLGLDMQQVIMTFANDSTMRLDALGLSVEDVTGKVAELEANGFQGDAFDEAVLIALEQKMTLLGDASETTAGKMQILESNWDNLVNRMKQGAAETAGPVVDALVTTLSEVDLLNEGLERGIITQGEYNKAVYVMNNEQRQQSGILDKISTAIEAVDMRQDFYNRTLAAGAEQYAANKRALALLRGEVDVATVDFDALAMVTDELTAKGGTYRGLLRDQAMAAEAAAAAAEELTAEEEAQIAATIALKEAYDADLNEALQRNIELTAQAAATLQNDMISALQTGVPAVDGYNESLLAQLDSMGASAETYGMAAIALGEYDKKQVEAALNAAIMQGRITELATEFNNGQISAEELRLEMEALANGTYKPEVDVNVDPARAKIAALRSELEALGGSTGRGAQTGVNPLDGDIIPNAPAAPTGTKYGGGKAAGGAVFAGTSYLVGERGMEMFTPTTNGTITPNNQLGGVTIDMRGATFGGATSPAMIKAAVDAAMRQYGQQTQSRIRI